MECTRQSILQPVRASQFAASFEGDRHVRTVQFRQPERHRHHARRPKGALPLAHGPHLRTCSARYVGRLGGLLHDRLRRR